MTIINTHDQLTAAGGGIAIVEGSLPGRNTGSSVWRVYRVNANGQKLVTDPNAAWYNYQQKTFIYRPDKMTALEEAKAWVATTYGEHGPWKRNRMRDYIPERVFKEFPLPKKELTFRSDRGTILFVGGNGASDKTRGERK